MNQAINRGVRSKGYPISPSLLIIHFAPYGLLSISSGVGVFFLRQDEPPEVLAAPMVAAAYKANDGVGFGEGGGCHRLTAK